MGLDKNTYIVYKYTSPSGGVYIGLTNLTLTLRAGKSGKRYLSRNKETGEFLQPALAHAIVKYGWENFQKEILYENLTSEEADILEQEQIKFYRLGGKCYNIANGGKGASGVNDRKIKQYSLKGVLIKEWNSMKEAAESLPNPNALSNISACCLKKKYRAYGYIWRYAEDIEDIQALSPYRAPVVQYYQNGDYINTYPTIAEASRQTGVHESGIGNCIKGRAKTAGGYVWKFKEL